MPPSPLPSSPEHLACSLRVQYLLLLGQPGQGAQHQVRGVARQAANATTATMAQQPLGRTSVTCYNRLAGIVILQQPETQLDSGAELTFRA